tara:strand:- start:789 stop:1211 length:423 start_codon:yes stop_codon:yes gene_type:complete
MSITAAALVCLSLNVYHEARDQPLEGQIAVAQVTMSRVASDVFPDDVCGVVWQPSQFSWTHDGKSDKPKEKKAWETAKAIAQIVSTNDIKDETTGATDYHADYVAPYWAKGYYHTVTIGTHIFYTRHQSPTTSIRPKARP